MTPATGATAAAATAAAAVTPYDVAKAELAIGVKEVAGAAHNPRIVLYHASTGVTGSSAADEVAWCSSFVNFCVEQAGLVGTDSQWARSWHDAKWGEDVTDAPQEGDIVVFRRKNASVDGGHVGFWVKETADKIQVLGGNQSDSVRKTWYPKKGKLGPFDYTLLSVRRA